MTFRMESWSSTSATWDRHDRRPAKGPWKPRETADDAITKCLDWTGRTGIPAMQVVDNDTEQVVWRDAHQYPDAGPSIAPPPPAPFQTALAL